MLTTEAMAAAGWGPGFIDRVLAADAALADGTGDTAEGYWLRDAVWQVAWQLEGSRGEYGPWTDAAYLYAAAAAGGVPMPPAGVAESLEQLRAWIAAAEERRSELWAASRGRDAQAAGVGAAVRAADAQAAGSAGRARAHLPYDLLATPTASVSRAGTAWVAVSLARLDLRTHAAAVSHAATVRAAGTARLGALTAEAGAAAGEASRLREWLDAARGHEAALLAAQARYEDAASEWRAAVGRLLAEARAAADAGAEARVAGMDARYGLPPVPRPAAEVVAASGGRA